MAQASERPRRKRLSWDSRCEIVWLIEQGMSPPPGRGQGRREQSNRLPPVATLPGRRRIALRDRLSIPRCQPRRLPPEAEERILAARRRSAFGPVRLAGRVPHPPSTIGKILPPESQP
jgi:hypothetical protein